MFRRLTRISLFSLIAAAIGSASFYVTDSLVSVSGMTTAEAQKSSDAKRPLDPSKLAEPLPRNLFIELSKLVNPAVVSISTSRNVIRKSSRGLPRGQRDPRFQDPMQDFFDNFFGLQPYGMPGQPQPPPQVGLGTGFIIRADGLIITNNHVVAQADTIKVQLDPTSKESYEAKLIGRDDLTDIALIKISAKRELPTVTLGSSKEVQVGEWVAAFGNPYGHAHTMTKGIISAIGREISELNRIPFLQTDASINPGNSGGPLVNVAGQVIGVNTAIDARAQGIGFAIPIDSVKTIVKQLEETGSVRRGFLGVGIQPVTPEIAQYIGLDEPQGAIINQVYEGSPAQKAGLEAGDVVLEFNGKEIRSPSDLTNTVAAADIGQRLKMKIIRVSNEGKKSSKTLDVTITERPKEETAKTGDEGKKYFGQKAPFDLGFKVSDFSPQLAREFNLPPNIPSAPLVTDVERGSLAARAGIQVGDMILDVNRQPTKRATDVLKAFRSGPNIVRLARGGNVMLIITITTK